MPNLTEEHRPQGKKQAPKWTDEQRTAIDTRDRTVLLSAAAGSGKTAVLTERIIAAVTDKDNPLDLGRLLAVTFTRAAARELRNRIGAALAAQVEKHPDDPRLARQLRRLPMAKICTIDSFCGDLVRRYATRAGISDGYRVADQQETDLTRIALMEMLLEDAYAGLVPDVSAEDFADLVTHLYALREENGIGETLLSLIERMDTLEGGVDSLADFAAAYRHDAVTPLPETAWGREIRKICTEAGTHYRHAYDTLLREELPTPDMREKYTKYLEDYLTVICALTSPDTPYSALAALPSRKFVSAVSGFGAVAPKLKATLDDLRDKFIKKTLPPLVTYSEEAWRTLFERLARCTELLHRIAREFVAREAKESRRRGVYSFAQIERLAYSLLIQNGERTPLALSVSEEYDTVSVDEYQDVSPLQHAVFEALARERTRFLVGDIKQSIYRFRHADPSIFAALRRDFPAFDPTVDAPSASLFMSRNFRCDLPVVNYVNAVFDTLFGVCGESIGYTSADRLAFGKSTDGVSLTVKPVLAVFESLAGGMSAVAEGASYAEGLPDADHVAGGKDNPTPDIDREYLDVEENDADVHAEALWVASTVRDLIDRDTLHDGETSIRPSDIAVLLRSKRGKVVPYIEALQLYGVPVETPEATDFFSCPEVLLALSLLRTVDNPRRDVSLAAVLLSPLYRFSADDLAVIRRAAPEGIPLFDALVAWCASHPDFTRGHYFLAQLDSFRDAAEDISVDRLLRRLMSETPLMAIAGADGRGGENKIRLLYHYALRRSGGEEGLYSFIHYINRQIETGKTFTPPASAGETSGVTVMTIHSSKGLEFPIVFLADCGKHFSRMDCLNHFVYDGTHPVAFRLRDATGLLREENPVHRLVLHTMTEESAEEEMRLLYVALTRARERLYISGTLPAKKTIEDACADAARDARDISRFSVMRRASYLELLLLCQARDESFAHLLMSPVAEEPPTDTHVDFRPLSPSDETIDALAEEYRTRFSYQYPYIHLTHVPGKLSVSRLSPTLLDGTEEETTYLDALASHNHTVLDAPPHYEEEPQESGDTVTDHEKYRRMPEAYAGVQPPDPTVRGIVSHQFMQFCDFDRLATEGVDAEMERLIRDGFLSEEDAKLVRPQELERFRASSLLTLMREAKEVKREFRFHVRLPAARFTSDSALASALGEELLLVQGVMDAVILDHDGGITLVDYKTDRLTREECADPHLAAKKLRDRHTSQLRYYAAAIEEIFGTAPRRVAIYSLQLGDCIDLCLD